MTDSAQRNASAHAGPPAKSKDERVSNADHAECLQSELLAREGFRHAFFTRNGGVSSGPFESLSFSASVGDSPENVRQNLERAARELGVSTDRIFFASQVHGHEVVEIDAASSQPAVLRVEADAVWSRLPATACAVRSADCVPILLADRRSGAAAAVHAGWRGCVAGVVRSAVEALRRASGPDAELVAAIGPHISAEAFEVGESVAAELQALVAVPVVIRADGAKPHADLRRLVRAQLSAEGLADAAIDDVFGCTLRDPSRFFSYRRDGARSGRHLSAVVPRS
jgi:YfiH family protein